MFACILISPVLAARRRSRPRTAGLSGLRGVPFARSRPQHDRTKPCRSLGPQGREPGELRAIFAGAQGSRHRLGGCLARSVARRSGPDDSREPHDVCRDQGACEGGRIPGRGDRGWSTSHPSRPGSACPMPWPPATQPKSVATSSKGTFRPMRSGGCSPNGRKRPVWQLPACRSARLEWRFQVRCLGSTSRALRAG
jgi:hypothetical protein